MSSWASQFNGTTMLITGAVGFLASHLLETIAVFNESAKPGCRVLAVDNFQSGLPERISLIKDRPDMELRQGDASQAFEPGERVDRIIHAASIASPPLYRRFPLETIDVNVNGTRHMLDLLRRDGRGMLFVSSSEIYGDPDPLHIPTAEDYRGFVSCNGPRACYDESKRLGETPHVERFSRRSGEHDEQHASDSVPHITEAARCPPVAIKHHRPSVECRGHQIWNNPAVIQVLAGAVDIERPYDLTGEL
jgi:hypothetical protein